MKKYFRLNPFGVLSFKLILFVIITLLGIFVFDIESKGFYYCLIALFSISIFWLVLYETKIVNFHNQAFFQLIADVTIENLLIHFSGGLESPLILLIILDLFLGAYLLPKRKMYLLAVYVSVFYAGFSTLSYLDFLPIFMRISKNILPSAEVYFYYVIYMRVFIFFMMGYLASQLSGRLFSQMVKIEEMQHFTDKILFQMGSGLMSVNNQNIIIYVNKAANDILNIEEDLLNKNWQDIFFKDDENFEKNEFISNAYSHNGAEMTYVKDLENNNIIHLNVSISDFKDEHAQIAGKTIIFRDLTFYKEIEHLRAEREKMQTLGELASTLAHEIKNPLASICGSLEVLQMSNSFNDFKSKKLVDVIVKESDRLTRTLTEFLTFSGDVPLRKKNYSISSMIEDIVLVLNNHSDKSPDTELIFNYDTSNNYISYLDENYFKQMIFNLVLNGLQAIDKKGSVTINLIEKKIENNNYILIEIKDTGKGIPSNVKKNIFKPFYSTRSKGIGLGLTVCIKVAKKHGWDIDFDSDSKGTVFRINIPSYTEF